MSYHCLDPGRALREQNQDNRFQKSQHFDIALKVNELTHFSIGQNLLKKILITDKY